MKAENQRVSRRAALCRDRQLHRSRELEEWDLRGIIRAIIIDALERVYSCNSIIPGGIVVMWVSASIQAPREEPGWKNVTRIRCRTCRLAFTAYYYRKSTCAGILISSSSIQILLRTALLTHKTKIDSASVIDYAFNRLGWRIYSDDGVSDFPNARNTIQRILESCDFSATNRFDQVD